MRARKTRKLEPISDANLEDDSEENSIFSVKMPIWEMIFYAIFFIFSFGGIHVNFYLNYHDLDKKYPSEKLFKKGWFGRSEEICNPGFEQYRQTWHILHFIGLVQVVFSRLGQVFVSESCSAVLSTSVTLIGLSYLTSFQIMLFFLFLYLIIFTASYMHKLAAHLLVIAAFLACIDEYVSFDDDEIVKSNVFYYTFGYIACRFISCGHVIGQETAGSFSEFIQLHFLSSIRYCFYWHQLGGPILTYRDFRERIKNRPTHKINWSRTISRSLRLSLYYNLIRLYQHFFYTHAFVRVQTRHSMLLQSPFVYSMVVLVAAINFSVLFTIIYGAAGIFSHLDGIDLYSWPRCCLTVHSFRNMWRVWDVGLTKVVRDHIYIPLGGSKEGAGRQLVATAFAFVFIYCYHGGSLHEGHPELYGYIGMNFVQVLSEILAEKLYSSYLKQHLIERVGLSTLRRIIVIFASLNFQIVGHTGPLFVIDMPYGMWITERSLLVYKQKESFGYFFLVWVIAYMHTNMTVYYEGYIRRKRKQEREEKKL